MSTAHRVVEIMRRVGIDPKIKFSLLALPQTAVLPLSGEPNDAFCFRMRADKKRTTISHSKQHRTFPHRTISPDVRGQKRLQVAPLTQILRLVQQRGASFSPQSGTHQKKPPPLFTPDKRVTKIGRGITRNRRKPS